MIGIGFIVMGTCFFAGGMIVGGMAVLAAEAYIANEVAGFVSHK